MPMGERDGSFVRVALIVAAAQFMRERDQQPGPMRACRFTIASLVHPALAFDGWTDDTTWNGWANVWVTPEVHAQMGDALADWHTDPQCSWDEVREFYSLPVGEDGRLSLNGFTCELVGEGVACLGCGARVAEDDVVWAMPDGQLNTDAGSPWCVTCVPGGRS